MRYVEALTGATCPIDEPRALGLEEPLVTQYARFPGHAVRGDFGVSIRAPRPALQVVLEWLPATLLLTAGAFVFRATA
jgi:peptide/nickel transport system permease protein